MCLPGTPSAEHCDYARSRPRRVLAAKLRDYAPEAHFFLSRLQLTTDDLEDMMAQWTYNETYTSYENVPKRNRHAVCDWVKENAGRLRGAFYAGWSGRRCLGEVNATLDPAGALSVGAECSGHGSCTTAPELDFGGSGGGGGTFYAGVCECDRGYAGAACDEFAPAESVNLGLELRQRAFGELNVEVLRRPLHEPVGNLWLAQQVAVGKGHVRLDVQHWRPVDQVDPAQV